MSKRAAIFVGKCVIDGTVETHFLRDLSRDITIANITCPTCGGPGVQIYPRMKADVFWPVICYWCGASDYEFTSKITRPKVERDPAWIEGMTQTLIGNMSQDMVEALKENEDGSNYYDF